MFELFPQLPAELRIKIWRMTMPDLSTPQNIIMKGRLGTITFCTAFASEGECVNGITKHHLPITLQICAESRHEAKDNMKNHDFAFDIVLYTPILFNYEVDTLTFMDPGAAIGFGMSYGLNVGLDAKIKARHVAIRGVVRDEVGSVQMLASCLIYFWYCQDFTFYVDPAHRIEWEPRFCAQFKQDLEERWIEESNSRIHSRDRNSFPRLTWVWEK